MQYISFQVESLRASRANGVTSSSSGAGAHLLHHLEESGDFGPHGEDLRVPELESEIKSLRESVKGLEKENEDLKGQILNRGVEEGNKLLQQTPNSLEAEFKKMNESEVSYSSKGFNV